MIASDSSLRSEGQKRTEGVERVFLGRGVCCCGRREYQAGGQGQDTETICKDIKKVTDGVTFFDAYLLGCLFEINNVRPVCLFRDR